MWRTCAFAILITIASATPAAAAAGDLDHGFSGDGRATVDLGTGDEGFSTIALDDDGSILLVGGMDQGGPDSELAMARLTSSGDLDATFGTGGVQDVPAMPFGNAACLQDDGKIVVVSTGELNPGNVGWIVARFGSDGALDPTFGGGDGVVTTDWHPSEPDAPYDVVAQPDGKIVVVGFEGLDDGWRSAVARYEGDGDLDPSFGVGGKASVRVGRASRASGVALQANGKIVIVGESQRAGKFDFGVARFLTDGTLDLAFGDQGAVRTDFGGGFDNASELAIQPDGKIVVVGQASRGTTPGDFGAARYRTNGALDRSFSDDGRMRIDFKGEDDWAQGVAIQTNGKIVLAGWAYLSDGTSQFALARLTTEGALSRSFGNAGRVRTNFGGGPNDYAFDVALQPDGMIVATGWAQPDSRGDYDGGVARYHAT